MKVDYYNNIGICVVAIGAVLNHSKEVSLSKLFLIFPVLSHYKLSQHLARKNTKIMSVEKLIAEKISFFSNFNKRYFDSLVLTMNSLQYLTEAGHVEITTDGFVKLITPFEYDSSMGKRAKRMFNASENVSKILKEKTSNLYLNLRVKI